MPVTTKKRTIKPKPKPKYALRGALIDAIAHMLVDDQPRKSIDLQLQKPYAQEWAKVRNLTSIHGYATFEEAVECLRSDLA